MNPNFIDIKFLSPNIAQQVSSKCSSTPRRATAPCRRATNYLQAAAPPSRSTPLRHLVSTLPPRPGHTATLVHVMDRQDDDDDVQYVRSLNLQQNATNSMLFNLHS
jgi:hypothetical protein